LLRGRSGEVFPVAHPDLSQEARRLSATFYAEWCLADTRPARRHIVTEIDADVRRPVRAHAFPAEFGGRIASSTSVTTARSRPIAPSSSAQRHARHSGGAGSSAICRVGSGRPSTRAGPCIRQSRSTRASTSIPVRTAEGRDRAHARELVAKYRRVEEAEKELGRVTAQGHDRSRRWTCITPDVALNNVDDVRASRLSAGSKCIIGRSYEC